MVAISVCLAVDVGCDHNGNYVTLNSLRPSDMYRNQYTMPSLVQVIACCLFGTQPLSETMLAYWWLDTWEQISVKCESQCNNFKAKIWSWKCCMQFPMHFLRDNKPALIQIMAWCCNYLNQSWPNLLKPISVIQTLWVNYVFRSEALHVPLYIVHVYNLACRWLNAWLQ